MPCRSNNSPLGVAPDRIYLGLAAATVIDVQRQSGYVPGGEISTPQHWGPAFRTAAAADITWRRQREASAAGDPTTGHLSSE